MTELRNAACEYGYMGWSILPLRPRAKQPLGTLVPHGKDQSSTGLAEIFEWWMRFPDANIGLNCRASGLIAIDVDPRHGGDDSLYELQRSLGPLPRSAKALSGGGGEHILFIHPGNQVCGTLGPGLDMIDNKYIVLPPSVHPSGRRYEWEFAPTEHEITVLPPTWLDAIAPHGVATRHPELNLNHNDTLRNVPAAKYVESLTKRPILTGGWVQCPLHGGGEERTPSFRVAGSLWACYGCQPPLHKQVMGGNIYDLAALLFGFPIPLRGIDFIETRRRLIKCILPS